MSVRGPKGWTAETKISRFLGVASQSYSASARTVDCIISAGSPVKRFYGIETLRIDAKSVDLDRVRRGVALLLDSHRGESINNALGKISNAWIDSARLMGTLSFNDTEPGRNAEGMIARGELSGISAGYSVQTWEISDEDGRVLDPDSVQWSDENLTFCATRWTLMECSLVCTPADSLSGIRSLSSGGDPLRDVRARMNARQRISERQSNYYKRQQDSQ